VAGYTECLRQELLPHGIKVSLCFPPTTDTPGLAKENEVKPPETWAIEGSSRAFSAADVAAALLDGIAREKFEILVGFDSGLIWRLNRAAPWLMRRVLDGILLKHLEKAKRSVVS
jgi:3-dehydrosphinganine reductase